MRKNAQKQRATERIAKERIADHRSKGLEKNQTREWNVGDVYSPHDLSPVEMRKWKKRHGPSTDVFDALALDPLKQYKVRDPHLRTCMGRR